MNITEIERICSEANKAAPFDESYLSLIRAVIKKVDDRGNNCEDIIPLIQLQETISALSQEELINFDRSKNILKIFTGDYTDNLIDHLRECGGSTEGTQQFIQNIIMLEARNACIFPNPPGHLHFNEAAQVAKQVASEFPGMGLLSLNSRKDEITKKTVQAFVSPIIEKQVFALTGEKINSNELDLPSIKTLDSIKETNALDYTTGVLSSDLPLELVDQLMPRIIDSSFSDIIGHLPESEKEVYLRDELQAPIKDQFEICMAPHKQRLRFHDSALSPKEMIRYRQGLRDEFCTVNPSHCEQVGCDFHTNYFNTRADITDLNMIQSCLFQSINNVIPKVIELTIKNQTAELKDLIDVNEELNQSLSRFSAEQLNSCMNSEIQNKTQKDFNTIIPGHPEAYLFLEANDYQDIVLTCAAKLERDVTKEVAALVLATTPSYTQIIPSRPIKRKGQEIDEESFKVAQTLVGTTIDECYQAQNTDLLSIDSSLCQPMIELQAGINVISYNLNTLLTEKGIEESKRQKLVAQYQSCANDAYQEALLNMDSKSEQGRLRSSKDAESYLDNNPAFYECAQVSILQAVDEVIETEIDLLREELVKQDTDPRSLDDIRQDLARQLRSCFERGIQSVPNWSGFIEYNEQEGIDQLQNKCTREAEEFALPKIINKQLETQLVDLQETNVLALTTEEYIQRLAPTSSGETSEEILLGLYQDFKQQNPDKDVNDFVEVFKRDAQLEVMRGVHEQIVQEISDRAKIGFPQYEELSRALTPQCLSDIYTLQEDNINILIDKISANSDENSGEQLDLRELFIEIISDGLYHNLTQQRFEHLISTVDAICANPSEYSDLKQVTELRIGDDFIAKFIQKEIKLAFTDVAKTQCLEEFEGLNLMGSGEGQIPQDLVNELCDPAVKYDSEAQGIINSIYAQLDNTDAKIRVGLIWRRKKETLNLVASHFNTSEIEKLLIQDRAVLDYIYKNFASVVAQEEKSINEVTRLVIGNIFRDTSPDGFASQFVESQLISAIGITGVPIARNQMETGVENLEGFIQGRGFVKKRARQFGEGVFRNTWSYEGIRHHFDWENLDQTKRDEIIGDVVRTNIMPRYNQNLTSKQQKDLATEMNEIVFNHLEQSRTRPNPNFRPERTVQYYQPYAIKPIPITYPEQGPRMLNFYESVEQAIESGITERVTNSFWPF